MVVRLGSVSLVGIILESVCYGVFLVLFIYNVYLQWRNYGDTFSSKPNMVPLIVSVLLFCLITAHWCLDVARLYEAVITVAHKVPINLYFANLPDPKQVAVTGLFDLEVLTGDLILIYRLYHVYQSNWLVCIIPASSWAAMVVVLGFLLKAMSDTSLATGVFVPHVERWVLASFCLTLAINGYCTALIILRLWRGRRAPGQTNCSYIARVLRIFVESAAYVTIYILCAFITFEVGNNVQYALIDTLGPTVGISFILILVRLNRHRTGDWKSQFAQGLVVNTEMHSTPSTYHVNPINIEVSTDVNVDYDLGKSKRHSRLGMV